MTSPRVTMQQVAEAAGVHQTTVSLALRNDPRLPPQTRERIQKIARKLGYRPDPMLAALNFYRTARHPARAPITMAFLLNFRDADELATSHAHQQFLEGARHQADQIGYRLEVFYVGHDTEAATAGARIERILRARGITGLIIAAFGDSLSDFQLSWDQFSAVQIESQHLGLSLHTISNHQLMITREAVRRLAQRGFRRIGLAVGVREERYLKNAYTAGYYVEMAQSDRLARVAPCILPEDKPAEVDGMLHQWARTNEVDAVVSNWISMPEIFRRNGWRVPGDVTVASLDWNPGAGAEAGMKQNHRTVGVRAVEQLAILMKTNQRGLVDTPNLTLIEGEWQDSRPAGRKRSRPRKA